jgi:serine/threonine protein phosphatase PrpC
VTVKLTVVGRTDVGKVRTNNEDAFVVADLARSAKLDTVEGEKSLELPAEGMLLAVSDGMGGEEAGEVASALVVESLRRELAANKDVVSTEAITKMLDTAVFGANKEVFDASKEPGKKGMGATLTAVCVMGDTAFIAEVGDSRAYLIRAHRIRQMTRDQSFVQLLVDAGAISPDEAKDYPHKNVILQAMGQKADVKPAIGKLALRRFDKLLLCSDGLSNKVQDTEMREIVEATSSLDAACKKLIELANERGGEDNVTVVIAELSGEGLAPNKDSESVTQTFEIVRDFVQLEEGKGKPAKGDAPAAEKPQEEKKSEPAAAPADDKAAEAKDAEEEEEEEEDNAPKPTDESAPGDLTTRPQQMVVAAVMIAVVLYVLWEFTHG